MDQGHRHYREPVEAMHITKLPQASKFSCCDGSPKCFCGIVKLSSLPNGVSIVPASSCLLDMVYASAMIYGNMQQHPP